MLLSLHVKNLALIEEEEIEFTQGLNILTGETGAGKSILIGSVNIALGAKADKNLIRTGAESALIELTFQIDHEQQRAKLQELELPIEDDLILIKRKIQSSRTVSSVNGETVTAAQLRELADVLMELCGQRDNQKLLKKEQQLALLDDYLGEQGKTLKQQVGSLYRERNRLLREYKAADLDERTLLREIDLLSYELQEISEAVLKPGEDELLEQQYRLFSNFRRISEAVSLTEGLITGSNESASEAVARALRELLSVSALDPELSELSEQLSQIDSLLGDFERGLSAYIRGMSYDPEEAAAVEQRLDLINHLKEKYGRTIGDVLAAGEKKQERLEELRDNEQIRNRLKQELEKAENRLEKACEALSTMRKEAAGQLCRRLEKTLLELNFNQARLEVLFESGGEHLTAEGYDEVCICISMNPGEALRPLAEIASGGELSRIMLGIKTVPADSDQVSTFIFDEIDAGISGQTAWKVSEKLGQLAADHQIICITHLPQIAAMEDTHFLIRKEVRDGRTLTHIRRLSEEQSNDELARLLGGETLTDSARVNASEMKKQAVLAKTSGH